MGQAQTEKKLKKEIFFRSDRIPKKSMTAYRKYISISCHKKEFYWFKSIFILKEALHSLLKLIHLPFDTHPS